MSATASGPVLRRHWLGRPGWALLSMVAAALVVVPVAMLVAGVGALSVVGYAPVVAVARFEYAAFALALAGAFVLVYRLGAGLHGLGRRGVLVVVVGAVVLTGTLLYAELLRRYGTQDLVESLLDGVRWSREELGAFFESYRMLESKSVSVTEQLDREQTLARMKRTDDA